MRVTLSYLIVLFFAFCFCFVLFLRCFRFWFCFCLLFVSFFFGLVYPMFRFIVYFLLSLETHVSSIQTNFAIDYVFVCLFDRV